MLIASCTGKASKSEQTEESSSTIELKDTSVVDTTVAAELTPDTTEMKDSIITEVQIVE